MPFDVRPDRYFFGSARLVLEFDKEPLSVRIEAEHVVQQAPHFQVEEAFRLTEHCEEIVPRPLERTHIAGDRERHLCLYYTFREVWKEVEKIEEVRIGVGVEDNLSMTFQLCCQPFGCCFMETHETTVCTNVREYPIEQRKA